MTEHQNLSCEIVRDLLPLYHDGVVSEATAAAVGEHLDGCDDCRAEYTGLCQALPGQTEKEVSTKKKFTALMGRQKKKKVLMVIAAVALTAVLMIGLWVVLTQKNLAYVDESYYTVDEVYRFETETGPKFFVRYTDSYAGRHAMKLDTVWDKAHESPTLSVGLIRPILVPPSEIRLKEYPYTHYWILNASAHSEDGLIDYTALTYCGDVIWSENMDTVEDVPGYVYSLNEVDEMLYAAGGGSSTYKVEDDYVYIRYPDGREEYWDRDGNLLDGPMKYE